MNRSRPSRFASPLLLAAVAVAASTCGGNPQGPSNDPRWSLDLLVTDQQNQPVAGATARIIDGPNVGRATTSAANGHALFAELVQSAFTVSVSAEAFFDNSIAVTLLSSRNETIRLAHQPSGANAPPVISFTVVDLRDEPETTLTLTPVVQDDITPIDKLVYEWSAPRGVFVTSGRTAVWRAPAKSERTPYAVVIQATAIERYTQTNVDGTVEQRENRATAEVTVHVNDSDAEVRDVTLEFLDDFTTYAVQAEECVENFSDTGTAIDLDGTPRLCGKEKALELVQIRDNRLDFRIYPPPASKYSVSQVFFNTDRMYANVVGPCEFNSLEKETNLVGTVKGQCQLTAVYVNWGWWLCSSYFRETAPSPFKSLFIR